VAGNTFMAISVNPDRYLGWIKANLESIHDVQFIRASVKSLDEAREILGTSILINASGLGAKELANDQQVVGIRGQTMFVDFPRDPKNPSRVLDREVRIRRGAEYTYVLPRMLSGGVVIGGVEQEGRTETEVSVDLQKDIIRRVNVMTNGWFTDLKLSDVKQNIVGIRPGREGGYRIEKVGNIVHAYGFGGAGYRYSIGAAEVIASMLRQLTPGASRL
jgi:D-amino-acid oxidase